MLTGTMGFERHLQSKRRLRAFHVECGITKKRVCYCPANASMLPDLVNPAAKVQSMLIASDLLQYYEGYEPDLEDRLQRKVIRFSV
jgi:hypothetical protein